MAAILEAVGTVFTSAIGWVGSVGSAIAGTTTTESGTVFNNPILLLFCVAIPLVGLGVGMFKRLLSTRG